MISKEAMELTRRFTQDELAEDLVTLRAENSQLREIVGRWNFDLAAMPNDGRFEVLRVYNEVFRHLPEYKTVIEPRHGRMFVPLAWRLFNDGPST